MQATTVLVRTRLGRLWCWTAMMCRCWAGHKTTRCTSRPAGHWTNETQIRCTCMQSASWQHARTCCHMHASHRALAVLVVSDCATVLLPFDKGVNRTNGGGRNLCIAAAALPAIVYLHGDSININSIQVWSMHLGCVILSYRL